jgi:hypothetical protein
MKACKRILTGRPSFLYFCWKELTPLLLSNIIKAEIKQKEAREVAIMPVLAKGGGLGWS